MSWYLFDKRGRRPQKLTLWPSGEITPGWCDDHVNWAYGSSGVFGFVDGCRWDPTWFAAKMSKGYRVFRIEVGSVVHVDPVELTHWWRSASPDQKRLPTLAAVEMYLRHTA